MRISEGPDHCLLLLVDTAIIRKEANDVLNSDGNIRPSSNPGQSPSPTTVSPPSSPNSFCTTSVGAESSKAPEFPTNPTSPSKNQASKTTDTSLDHCIFS